MANLFSIFDPSIYCSSPLLFVIVIYFVFSYYWSALGSFFSFWVYISNALSLEFHSSVKPYNKSADSGVLLSGFMFIFLINFLSLFPSVYTLTGHILFTFTMSILVWTLLILFLLTLNFKSFISHLVPFGTPGFLVVFMVMVELVSNLIRPITLSVRLMANLVAGHLLLSLLGSFLLGVGPVSLFLFFSMGLVLTVLELSVCIIQSYVFFTLFSLYSEEAH